MKIGYLHLGIPEHGVCRYSHLLASEAKKCSDINVIEANVVLTNKWRHNSKVLKAAAKILSQADIVHFQYNSSCIGSIWQRGWVQFFWLRIFLTNCSSLLLATFHDINLYDRKEETLGYSNNLKLSLLNIKKRFRIGLLGNRCNIFIFLSNIFKSMFLDKIPSFISFYWLLNRLEVVFVCTHDEKRRLGLINKKMREKKVNVLPHFIEQRDNKVMPEEARKSLGLDRFKIITILGYIYSSKGYRLMVEAMTNLPRDIKVIFAGGPCFQDKTSEKFVAELLELAKSYGVQDRLEITGYLPENKLELFLYATDLAVCPFENASASSSLSTWISVARPIIASDLPLISDYNKIAAGAIKVFKPYTALALSQAIKQHLSIHHENEDPIVLKLKYSLAIKEIFKRHLDIYYDILSQSRHKRRNKL